MNLDTNVIGCVLAGGESRRMGTDKALVLFEGRPLLIRAIDVLRHSGCASVDVLHRRPDRLSSLPFGSDVTVRSDAHGGQGPLDGLLSAFGVESSATISGSLVATLPVDLPRVTPEAVREMIAVLTASDRLDAVHLTDGTSVQHLAAVWRADRCHDPLRRAFESGERSPRRAIEGLATGRVIVPSVMLVNVNTPTDIVSSPLA